MPPSLCLSPWLCGSCLETAKRCRWCWWVAGTLVSCRRGGSLCLQKWGGWGGAGHGVSFASPHLVVLTALQAEYFGEENHLIGCPSLCPSSFSVLLSQQDTTHSTHNSTAFPQALLPHLPLRILLKTHLVWSSDCQHFTQPPNFPLSPSQCTATGKENGRPGTLAGYLESGLGQGWGGVGWEPLFVLHRGMRGTQEEKRGTPGFARLWFSATQNFHTIGHCSSPPATSL